MKYKKKAVCPPILENWLDLINSVPFDEEIFPSWKALWGIAYFELTGEDISLLLPTEFDYIDKQHLTFEREKAMSSAVAKAVKSLKTKTEIFPKLHKYLFEVENKPKPESIFADNYTYEAKLRDYERSAHYRYRHFLEMQLDIRTVARTCMEYYRKGYFIDHEVIAERLGLKNRNKSYRSDFIINNGKVDFESELIQVLRGIDSARLRICPICDKVFWVKRIETNTCSNRQCLNNFHQRKLRIAEYKKRFGEADAAYKKLASNLSPTNSLVEEKRQEVNNLQKKIGTEEMKNGIFPSSGNELIEQARRKAYKLKEKINKEKMKNGTL